MTKFEIVESRIEEVKQDYGNMSVKDLEKKYGASYSTIQNVLRKYGYIKGRPQQVKYKYLQENIASFKHDVEKSELTNHELSEKYKCSEYMIIEMMQRYQLKRKNAVDKIDIYSLIEDYKCNMSIKAIEEKYNTSRFTIAKILKDNNIPQKRIYREYSYDETYFDCIDTETKAYFLGFIYADGCHEEDRNSLLITIQEQDEYILEKFLKELKTNNVVHKLYNKKYNRYYSRINISNKNLSQQLSMLGVVSNKTFKITFPTFINNDLIHHFIRGYWDGDGSIMLNKEKKRPQISVCGNSQFLQGLHQHLLSNINDLNPLTFCEDKRSKNCFLSSGGRYQIKKILDYIYRDSSIYLSRKYNKYQEILKFIKEEENEKNRRNEKVS